MREDAAAEADLMRAGYRDRVFTELTQNAADAATRAGVPGRVGVRLVADSLHVTNTGAPLDRAGVHALAALRASAKDGSGVGRFGVGFTAVLTISDDVEIRSTSGSIRFSAARTAAELDHLGIERIAVPATLRLPWPVDTAPPPGVTTEVVARLRPDVDASALLDTIAEESSDLLLELPALESIAIGATVMRTVRRAARPDGVDVVTVGAQTWWQYRTERARWLLPIVDGRPTALGNDVLRAPTRSDEELSLPTMLIADVEMQPDRRRIMPGTDIAGLARGYAGFARATLAEADLVLVPRPSFARSEVDRVLREAVLAELRQTPWLPVVGSDEPVAPAQASMLPGLSADLADLLADVIPALLPPELSGREQERPLAELDVHRLGLARLADLLAGLDRPPPWWARLYAALDPLVIDRIAVEELGALPVPLADGRTVTGPRTTVTSQDAGGSSGIPVHWARLVHAAAGHPLLTRLGAHESTPLDLLCDPALQAAIEDAADRLDVDGGDDLETVTDLGAAVLTLAGSVADPTQLPAWLGAIPLPADDGEFYPADELLLPGAPLAQVLLADAPFAVVDPALERQYGRAALEAVGVAWSFGVLRAPNPTGPDHHLDDEQRWWDSLTDDPPELVAVRDLDLVAPREWPRALVLLAADRRIRPLLADPAGYTAWWLRHHAVVDGQLLGLLRPADDATFAGLLDPLADPDLDAAAQAVRGALADPERLDIELAQVLVERLADPDRSPAPGTVADVHRRLAEAVTAGMLTPGDVALPAQVRTIAGTLADPDDVVVLDRPWFAAAIPPHQLVVGALESAPALATLLDLRLASQAVGAEVLGAGRETDWFADPFGVLAQLAAGRPPTPGRLVVHDEFRVRLFGAVEGVAAVPFWFEPDGTGHLAAPQRPD
ncbi:MAG TPA: ATP-binding protein [Aldersonia sp.]